MSKTPIEPADIRKGDLIRWEYEGDGGWLELTACEARVKRDGQRLSNRGGQHYLLERPKPAVDLPPEPTLGWLTSTANARVLNVWRPQMLTGGSGVEPDPSRGFRALDFEITAFMPATAVPTEALDRFRHLRDTRNLANSDVDTFLAAIDEANA